MIMKLFRFLQGSNRTLCVIIGGWTLLSSYRNFSNPRFNYIADTPINTYKAPHRNMETTSILFQLGSCPVRVWVRVRFRSGSCPGPWFLSGLVSGSCLVLVWVHVWVRVRVRVWFVFGFVSGLCLVRVWFVSGSCLVRVWFCSGFVFGSCLVRIQSYFVRIWVRVWVCV